MVFIASFLFSCSTSYYYVTRHGEKETVSGSSDVALNERGKQRAEDLKSLLAAKGITEIYSTPFIRTRSTVQPLAQHLNLEVKTYKPLDTLIFNQLRTSKHNFLIAGHSNTVDDIVNHLLGSKAIAGDLPETQYGALFIIKRKGKKYSLETRSY
jgi:broad specificity phosphatase PhoE